VSERAQLGPLPALVAGDGPDALLVGGLLPVAGVDGAARRLVEGALRPFARSRRVTAVNRRPGLPRGVTMAQIAAEHAEAIRAGFPGGPVDVIGVSTGGSIAQQLAADHPGVVRRLVLCGTGARLEGQIKADQRAVAARVRAGAPRRAFAVMAAALAPSRAAGVALGAAAALLGPRWFDDLDDLASTIEAEDAFDLAACAAPIRAPTLLVAGAEDRFYPRPLLEATAALIPDSRIETIPGRGHVSVMDDPRLAAAVERFLA
jgi:pimeloyl-ACP methyl ester carboxylesterase